MRYLVLILSLLFLYSCEEKLTKSNISKVEQNTEAKATEILIKGDFNGDGIEDKLKEILTSSINSKILDDLPKMEYDSLVTLIYKKKPILSLQSDNKKIPELILTKNASFGLLWIKNEGDLDNDGNDEISVVIDWPDWSAMNSCIVYSLKNNKWIEFAKFEIREWQILDNPGFKGFITKNENGEFKISTFDSEAIEIIISLKEVISKSK